MTNPKHNNQTVTRGGSILKKDNGYGCPIPYCKEKEGSWWTCYKCGYDVCKKHEVFNGKTVPYCAMCKPEKFNLTPYIVTLIIKRRQS